MGKVSKAMGCSSSQSLVSDGPQINLHARITTIDASISSHQIAMTASKASDETCPKLNGTHDPIDDHDDESGSSSSEERDLTLDQHDVIGSAVATALSIPLRCIEHVTMGGIDLCLSDTWLEQEVETDAEVSIRVKYWKGTWRSWQRHHNLDTCGEGQCGIILDWQETHSLHQLMTIVEANSYSGFTLYDGLVTDSDGFLPGQHCVFKHFDHQLTASQCTPGRRNETCTTWIYTRPAGEQLLRALHAGG